MAPRQPSPPRRALRLLERARAHRLARALPLLVFPLGCALAALAIGQDDNYDLLNYHYYIAYAFLHDRLPIDVYPAQLQSLLNPVLDVPIFLLMNHTPPRVEAAVVGAVQGLNPVIVYLIARRVSRSWLVGVAAALAAAVAGGFASEIGNSMGDSLVSIPLLLGVLFAVRAIECSNAAALTSSAPASAGGVVGGAPARQRRSLRRSGLWWWAAASLAAGVGAGLKFSELPVGIGVAVGVLVVRGSVTDRLKRLGACAGGGVVGTLIPSGYWSWYLWRNYKDPIAFTQASFGIFHSPYVPTASVAGAQFGPTSVAQALYFPVYWFFHPLSVAETPFRALSLPLAYALAALLVLLVCARALLRLVRGQLSMHPAAPADPVARLDSDVDRYLVAVFAVALAVWMKVFDVYRYIIPLELMSPLVVLAAGRRLLALLPGGSKRAPAKSRALVPGFLAACALCMATAYPGNYWLRVPFGSRYFSLKTPPILENGRADAVVEVGGLPMGFLLPQLPSRIVAIGGIGNLLTPANLRLVHRALARVRADHGDVDVVFVDVPAEPGLETPGGTSNYLAVLGAPGLVARTCDVERAEIGAGYEPVKFCRFGPAAKRR